MYIKKILPLLSFICFLFHVWISSVVFELWHFKIWVCKLLLNYLSYPFWIDKLTFASQTFFSLKMFGWLNVYLLRLLLRIEVAISNVHGFFPSFHYINSHKIRHIIMWTSKRKNRSETRFESQTEGKIGGITGGKIRVLLHFCTPYCYWWLIMKKRGWKLCHSPNPNLRGGTKVQ